MAHAGHLPRIEAAFKAADKNADGKLSLDEAKAGMPRIAARFAELDKEGKGFLRFDDIKAALDKHDK